MSDNNAAHATGLHHEYEWSENQAWTFEASVDCEEFSELVRAVEPLVGECRLRITPDSVYVKAVDAPNVSMVEVESDCVKDADGAITVGMMTKSLLDGLPPYYPCDQGGYDIRINHGSEEDSIDIRGAGDYNDVEVIHPDLVREPMEGWPEPDGGHEYDVTLPAPKVRGVLGALAETDAECVVLTPSDGEILFVAEGKRGDELYNWRLDAPVTSGKPIRVSTDCLADVIDAIYADGDIRMRFSPGKLLDLENDGARYVLAARINKEDL